MLARRTLLWSMIASAALLACSHKPNDAKIAEDIQSKAAADPVVSGSDVHVTSDKGKVTLTGTTASQAARDQLESIVRQEPGIVDMEDDTSVASATDFASTSGPAMASYREATSTAAPRVSPAPPPPPKPIVVPAGTTLTIRTNQALGSKASQTGHVFNGTILTPVTIDGVLVIPTGSEVMGIVKEAKKAGRFKGGAVLRLSLESVTVNGHTYNLQAEEVSQTSTGKGKRTAGVIAGGTGLGAAIGGIAGGGTGAAIGALTGAAAGTIGAGTTGKRDIDLPAEAALSFKLTQPLKLKPA